MLRLIKPLKYNASSVYLNTCLQRTCGIKGVNFSLFWGHRQLFTLDPNKLGARVLKNNILRPSSFSSVCQSTHTHTWTEYEWPQDFISVIMWLENPTRTLKHQGFTQNKRSLLLAIISFQKRSDELKHYPHLHPDSKLICLAVRLLNERPNWLHCILCIIIIFFNSLFLLLWL